MIWIDGHGKSDCGLITNDNSSQDGIFQNTLNLRNRKKSRNDRCPQMNLTDTVSIIQFGHMSTHRIEKSRIMKCRLMLETDDTNFSTLF